MRFNHRIDQLEHLWREKKSLLVHTATYNVYGYTARFMTNEPALLEATRISARCFSNCVPISDAKTIDLMFFYDAQGQDGALPTDLSTRLHYTFVGPRLTVLAEPWIQAFADMKEWKILGLVSPAIKQQPKFLSRYICDNFVFHLLMRSGPPGHIGHLHASTLYQDGRAAILSAPHNAGKSTTALRLIKNGYRVLTDSTTLVRLWNGKIELVGYPIGQMRLRPDTLDEFPLFKTYGVPVSAGAETKIALDLRERVPEWVLEDAIWPTEIVVCYLARTSNQLTKADPVSPAEMLDILRPESVFADDPAINPGNLMAVEALLKRARCYHLKLGTNPESIRQVIDSL